MLFNLPLALELATPLVVLALSGAAMAALCLWLGRRADDGEYIEAPQAKNPLELSAALNMKIKLAITWDSIRSSYWFVPCLMVGGAVLLSAATLALDSALPTNMRRATWLYSGDAEGARTLLATLAASMITIFGVVFSIVIVARTLAWSQFGPRLLRTFLRDTVDQVAVGTFISTFVYCVLVLRTVRASGSESFVPDISVTTAILLALFSLGVLNATNRCSAWLRERVTL